jgi:hypothetical protein
MRIVIISIILAVVLGVALGQRVRAHGEAAWIMEGGYRHPATGEFCCGPADCFVIPSANVEPQEDGGWKILNPQERIPRSEVQPSEDGRFWRCQRPDGGRRCFFAPPGVS